MGTPLGDRGLNVSYRLGGIKGDKKNQSHAITLVIGRKGIQPNQPEFPLVDLCISC